MGNYLLIDGKYHHLPQTGRSLSQPRPRPPSRKAARNFAAGEVDRLTASFTGSGLSVNEELRRSLQRMQWRSRQLCMDNDYARKFLKMVKANVIGPQGIKLQCDFTGSDNQPDLADQMLVEKEFKKWSKKKNASIDGKLSWLEIQNLAIETIARDGEVLIQKIRRKNGGHLLKLRVLECDHLDINHNEVLSQTRRVVMGVELDQYDSPIAYWLTNYHPGDYGHQMRVNRQRIPADQILHLFITERPGQIRGIPWMHSAIRRLNMLGGYEEAELIAARLGASKMGFFGSPTGDGMTPEEMSQSGSEYNDADLIDKVEPGVFEQLPDGTTFTPFDPQHPTSAFPDFTKAVLRGASSGLNVAYNTLANDLEGVNFSSIRSGVLEEREQWRQIQNWLAESLHDEIYHEWIQLENDRPGSVIAKLPADKIETKFSAIHWQPRGWQWVDPLKDVKSNAEEYALGTTSLSKIAAAKGEDLNDIYKQRRADLDLADRYGLTVGVTSSEIVIEDKENAEP